MFRLARASKSLKNESISTGQNYKPKLGHKYRGKAQRYNPENVFWKGEKTTGYGHDKKAWGKVDQIPKGRNKMQTDWRTTSPMVRQKSSENQEIWQRGVEGNNSDLKLQETIAKNHVGGFPKTLSKEYANGVDNKVPQQTAAYILHNRHQHQFEAAGLDQFSCMFQIPVITDSVPEKISEILPEFEKIAEQESSEYLKIAQKDRLFYQDPTIINKLKPVTTFMDESKRPWNYQSRDLGYLARHEGKSTAQEMSYWSFKI